jgi:hypothetical protein
MRARKALQVSGGDEVEKDEEGMSRRGKMMSTRRI